ncbi:hypothetical protein MKW94_006597 [Papaver nudicaule]|uniref:FAF domain-containing protein n=1 Tax=Papaver nudicaule TaxID=74823 RepID=A0AA41RWP2_PAPNU|nr:hypothetical protein [Papaver nudicaule]
MATCSSFQEIFEKPLPENPTLIESLASSWKKIKAKQQAEICSYTEIFGELHFKENLDPSSSSSSDPLPPPQMDVIALPENEKFNDQSNNKNIFENIFENKKDSSLSSLFGKPKTQYSSSANGNSGFSSKKTESLKLCTEGLGFESSDEVENSKSQNTDDWKDHGDEVVSDDPSSDNMSEMGTRTYPSSGNLCEGHIIKNSSSESLSELRRTRSLGRKFPPPISCIGRNGKPWVCLKSFRYSGRFVLREIKIQTKEVLRACREDGRLTLHLVIPDDKEILEEGEEEELEEEEESVAACEQERDEGEKSKDKFIKDEENQ